MAAWVIGFWVAVLTTGLGGALAWLFASLLGNCLYDVVIGDTA